VSEKLDWKLVRQKAGPYPQEAFQFVREGLAHTVKTIHGEAASEGRTGPGAEPHVSGQQLCIGLRDWAVRQYGMLAKTVLAQWGVRRTEDFGKIVFAMIDAGLMRGSETDTPEDFRGVYDFDEAFGTTETV
jgi:uncharacterized repeat protein (TIGR04138 family)